MNCDYLKEKKILIVDDEKDLLKMLVSMFNEYGYKNIITASSYKEALNEISESLPDIALLDVMLGDGNGFDLIEQIKKKADIPVLFLTARGEDEDKLVGLGAGADDYIVKPFLAKELILRVNAVLRRTYKSDSNTANLSACKIDFEKAVVIRNEKEIPLTAKEFELLFALYRNSGKIVTIDSLCEAAWGDNPFGYENSLMAHIRRIREKIEENPSKPVSLITVKGLGYKLITEDKK
ncbi:MAG: response regulator transcription factor [Bacillota bacterium]|nr:response regulator transcription factor [Bacillota bacterium]